MKLLLPLLLCFGCMQSRKIINSVSCNNKVNIQYDRNSSKRTLSVNESKSFTVFFLNEFHNRVKGYVNGSLKFNEMVETNVTTGKSDKNFIFRYENREPLPILKIEIEEGNCIDIKVQEGYRFVYIFYDSKKEWTVRFSNKYYVEN